MRLLISALVICLSSSAAAQDYFTNFKEYGGRDGYNAYEYSGTPVKDKKGFLWIGTDNGLYRFDGQNFKAFLHDPADSFSLPFDNNGVVFIERDGTFWINNGVKGVSHFDPVTEKFHPWQNTNTQEIDISKHQVNKIFQDSKERIWISVFGIGLGYLNKKDNTLKLFSFYPRSASPKWESTAYVNDVAEDNNHEFWIATHNGLIQFNPETKAFQIFKDTLHSIENNGRHADLNAVHIGYDGMIWTGTWGAGLKKFDPQKKTWETYCWDLQHLNNSTKNIVLSIIQKSSSELWVATYDGLLIFDIVAKKFNKVLSVNSTPANGISVTRLFEDASGILWCSGSKTLTKLETKTNVFHYKPVPDNPLYGSGLVACNTFLNDPASALLFIGTFHSKGLYTVNQRTGEVINYPVLKEKIYHENITQFLLDRDNKLWVCFTNGIRLFNIRTKQYEPVPASIKNVSFLNSGIYAALEDDDGSIWFGSREKGLLRFDKKLNEIKVFSLPDISMPADYPITLFKDSKGNIWVGYHGQSGIACIGANRSRIKFYNSSTYKIPQADVSAISESRQGSIFFTLYIYGLGEIKDPLSGKDSFKLYNKSNGLPGNRVINIIKDKQKNLWISTNNGLCLCDTREMSFQNFTVADGLRENNSDGTLYCDAAGLIYIGNLFGFQTFNPATFNNNQEKSPVILHSFKINGKEYPGDINAINSISLDHSEANFSFEYAALTFAKNDRITYAYRLTGLDKDWRYVDKQRIGAYSLAHGGDYTLQIKASNTPGQWNASPYELTIHVNPPFWETWWFIVLSILTAGLLIFWFTRRRIRMIRAAEERKTYINKIKAEAEMKALRAQMNPHFIFNCMNTIDAHIHKNNTEAASAFLHKFSQLIRQVLENSQYQSIAISKDLEALRLYIELEEQRNDFRFTHKILLPDQIVQAGYKIPPLLIQPYVENAILHGLRHKEDGPGLLTISFEEEEDKIICRVEDNGIGRKASALLYNPRDQQHRSLGLKVSNDRIESLNELYKTLSEATIIDKDDDKGTIVQLILPKIK